MEKIPIRELVICEGKYDKILLENILDATIITTEGFGIFHNGEKMSYIARIAKDRGVIVLTDSDSGGRQIRTYLTKYIPKEQIKNLYIPPIVGKEKRKKEHSKQNLLGVEGMAPTIIQELFAPFQNSLIEEKRKITKGDLFEWGILGKDHSSEYRREVLKAYDLPQMSTNALLDSLNLLGSYEEHQKRITTIINDFQKSNKEETQ